MGYRGSKSDITQISVKEQRVDGSRRKRKSSSSKVYSNGSRKKTSNQKPFLANIFKGFSFSAFARNVSTLVVKQLKLHPFFISGFSDGESYFSISISKSNKMKTG